MNPVPFADVTSPRGVPVDQLVSVLQKEIRRSNVDNAVLAAHEMLMTSAEVAEHLWERLKIIAVEDIGMGAPLAPLLVDCLHRNAGIGGAMMAVHAVRYLATAKKDRTSSENADLVAAGQRSTTRSWLITPLHRGVISQDPHRPNQQPPGMSVLR